MVHTCSPYNTTPVTHGQDIGRPRQLRRRHISEGRRVHIIHRLPFELLAHVFVLGAEDDANFAITVSQVCRAWRILALRTPAVWRRITLTADLDFLGERIRRAQSCTLDIQLLSWCRTGSGYPRHQFLDANAVKLRMHLVTPLVSRWRSLEIIFSEYSPFLWNAALARTCSRNRRPRALEQITLVYRLNDDPNEFSLFSGCAPKLRKVTVDGIRLAWLPSLFANLTHLDYAHHGFTVGHQAVDDVMSMLQVSTRLLELRLLFPRKPFIVLPTRTYPVTRRVALPSLAHLHLRIEGPDIPFELAQIMTLTITPRLTSLRLIDLDRRHHSFPSLKSFFYVYAIPPSLQYLHIDHGWYDHGMIPPMLRSLPDLHQVEIRRPHAPDHVLDLRTRDLKRSHGLRRRHLHGHSGSTSQGP